MRFYFLFVFLTFFSFQSTTAQFTTYEYLGVIKLNDTSFIPYKIVLEEVDGKLQGYSLTDLGGQHETKSNIKGSYNRETKELVFAEYDIVSTKSPIETFDFCLVNFSTKMRNLEKNKAFSGEFKARYPDGTSCLDGMIIMSNAKKVETRVAKIQKKVEKSKKISQEIKDKINLKRTVDTLTMSVVRKDENLNVFTKSKEILLSIYDSGKVDDDRINLYVNDSLILEDFSITRDKLELLIDNSNKETTVKVVALNEGTSAPNTVKVEILDGLNMIQTRTSLKTNESAELTLLKR